MYIVEQVDNKYYIATACGTRITYYYNKEKAELVLKKMNDYDHVRVELVMRKNRMLYAVYVGLKEMELYAGYERACHMRDKLREAYNMGYNDGKLQHA